MRKQTLVADVRVAATSSGIVDSIRAAVRTLDPSAPLTIQSVSNRIDESLVNERLLALIALFLGAASLLLACGALGGLMSRLVTARTREIGLRLALGAERRSVLGLAMRQSLAVSVLGTSIGLGVTLAGGRVRRPDGRIAIGVRPRRGDWSDMFGAIAPVQDVIPTRF